MTETVQEVKEVGGRADHELDSGDLVRGVHSHILKPINMFN